MPVSKQDQPRQRAVIVTGVRTPFVKAFAEYLPFDTIALGNAAVSSPHSVCRRDSPGISRRMSA